MVFFFHIYMYYDVYKIHQINLINCINRRTLFKHCGLLFEFCFKEEGSPLERHLLFY